MFIENLFVTFCAVAFVICTSDSTIDGEATTTEEITTPKPHVPNYMKFGETSKEYHTIFETIEELPPNGFFHYYVYKNKPLLMRNMAKKFEAYNKWTDSAIMERLEGYDNEYQVYVDHEKKESRAQEPQLMLMKTFLQEYKTNDLYMISSIPDFLRSDIPVPHVLQCEHVPNYIDRTLMWFSAGGTQSLIHYDNYENILCVLDGLKKIVLVNPNIYSSYFSTLLNSPDGTYSTIDINQFDVNQFDFTFYKFDLKAGDCLYIPRNWIHQVDSFERNIAVSFWFNTDTIPDLTIVNTCDSYRFDPAWTLDHLNLYSSIQEFLNILHKQVASTSVGMMFSNLKQLFAEHLGTNEDQLDEHGLSDYIKEVFEILDSNEDESITEAEITDIESSKYELVSQICYNLFQEVMELNSEASSVDQVEKRDEL